MIEIIIFFKITGDNMPSTYINVANRIKNRGKNN